MMKAKVISLAGALAIAGGWMAIAADEPPVQIDTQVLHHKSKGTSKPLDLGKHDFCKAADPIFKKGRAGRCFVQQRNDGAYELFATANTDGEDIFCVASCADRKDASK